MKKTIKIAMLLSCVFLLGGKVLNVYAVTVTNNPYVVSYNTITVGNGWMVGGFSSGLNCDKPPSDPYGLFTSCPNSGFYAVNTTLDGGVWTTYWALCTQRPNSLLGSCAHFTNYRSSYNCTYTTSVASWGACNSSGVQYPTAYNYATVAGSSCTDLAPTSQYCLTPPPTPSVSGASCNATGTQATISWWSSGATYYAIRNDRDSNSWSGTCASINTGDTCENTTGTSRTFGTTPGNSNFFWVHACNSAGCSAGAASTSFSCVAPPINGVCGSRSTTYAFSTATWPVGSTFCSSGTASPPSVTFPSVGSSSVWQCLGSGGGSTVSCSASRTNAPVFGSCGTRNTTYPSTTSAWPVGSTLCSAGTASPVSVSFPASGSTASWQCLGSGGGSSTSCLTTHQAPAIPPPTLTFSASPKTVNTGGSSTLTWSTSNVSSCWASGDWSGWKNAAGDNETQLNITANKTYYMECWNSSGGTTGVIPAHVAVNTPINGACGTRDTTYPSSATNWPVGSTLCTAGTQSLTPSFPSAGSSVTWNCNGINGGASDNCTATRQSSAINGACGTRNTNYPVSTTTWPGGSTLCSAGTASPVNPSFPAINSTTNWQCHGSGGGSNANCTASRVSMPAGTTFEEVSP